MTTPTTLADWATHCRAQADTHAAKAVDHEVFGCTNLARDAYSHAADWRALADLAGHVQRPGWLQQMAVTAAEAEGPLVAAVARLAEKLAQQ